MSRPSSRRLILSGYSFAQAVCASAVQGSAVSLRAGVGSSQANGRMGNQNAKFQSSAKVSQLRCTLVTVTCVLQVSPIRSHGLCHSIQ